MNFYNFFFYSIIYLLFFLLGNYFGSFYKIINIFLSFIIIADIFHYLISIYTIYYYQEFSIEHPTKGQNIKYKLTIENRSIFMPALIIVNFTSILKENTFIPKINGSSTVHFKSEFSLPYRGIYNVGVDKIICKDFLDIFSYNIPFWPRTFYVYPRINNDIKINNNGDGHLSTLDKTKSFLYADILNSIKEYRYGSKISNISWKHFAALGEPFLKDFDSNNGSDITVFLDKTAIKDDRLGPVDDIAIEVLISIIKLSINSGIKTKTNINNSFIVNEYDFTKFYKNSIYINFNKNEKETLLEYKTQNLKPEDNIVLITTYESKFYLDYEFIRSFPKLKIIIISKLLTKEQNSNLIKNIDKFSKFTDIKCIN